MVSGYHEKPGDPTCNAGGALQGVAAKVVSLTDLPILATAGQVAVALQIEGKNPAKQVRRLPIKQTRISPHRIRYHKKDVQEFVHRCRIQGSRT